MKIRTNLFLFSAIFVILIGALGFIVLQAFGQINREIKEHHSANTLIKDIFELNIVTYEHVMHHEKRMQQQWMLKYDSIGKLLERIREKESHPESQSILKSITFDYKALGNLFSQLQSNFVKRKRLIEENRSQVEINMTFALEERLIAQALMRAQKITSGAFRSSIIMQQRIARVQQKTNWIVLFSIIGFIIFSLCISFLTITAITRPLNKLVKSAEIIGEGNLDHRVDIKTKNEIGELAAAFNQMTERRSRAEEALRQGTHDLEERVKELKCLYEIGSLLQKPGISIDEILQEVVDLIPLSWQYPEITCARIFWKAQEFRTNNFRETEWRQASDIVANGEQVSALEVFYMEERPERDEGPFLKEERNLINAAAERLGEMIQRWQVEEELKKHREQLEELIQERTAELDKRISEVEQLNSAMVNLLADLRVSNENLELTTRQLSDANKELESFSYSVSHDLRAPLRAIDGFSQMLVEDHGDKLDEGAQHHLDVIQNSARQMGQLIDDLLAFSRLGRKGMSMSEIDMGVLAQEVFEQLQLGETERTARLNIDTLPPANGDRAMIQEVLVNFLSNAMKFTRPGKAPVIEVTGTVDENETVYSVKDKGVGFDMKYADKLFQVFQRLHSAEEFEGTGIGLALVQRIIHRHGGRVWAEGKVNKGATFYFSLPNREA